MNHKLMIEKCREIVFNFRFTSRINREKIKFFHFSIYKCILFYNNEKDTIMLKNHLECQQWSQVLTHGPPTNIVQSVKSSFYWSLIR